MKPNREQLNFRFFLTALGLLGLSANCISSPKLGVPNILLILISLCAVERFFALADLPANGDVVPRLRSGLHSQAAGFSHSTFIANL